MIKLIFIIITILILQIPAYFQGKCDGYAEGYFDCELEGFKNDKSI